MKGLKYPLAPLAILLVGCIVAYYFMREPTAPNGDSTSKELQPVDASALDSAVTLAALAATPDEQVQARDAWRLADQELDLHFAAAMRDAQTEVSQLSVPAGQALEKRILQLQAEVDADKKRVDDLAKDTTGELARAQTQLVLDQDQLDATREELERTIAPRQTYLQHLIQLHQIYDQKGLQALKFGTLPLVGSADEQFQAWLSLGGYMGQVNTARQQANQRIVSMNAERGTIQRQLSTLSGGSYLVATLRQMANFQKKLSGLDQRIQDMKQLNNLYNVWEMIVARRRREILHLLEQSLSEILAIVMAATLLSVAIRSAFRRGDHPRLERPRVIACFVVQVTATVIILLILLPPTGVSTTIGLISAGLAVVMKDLIVAFLGWFTLTARNGIRVGDRVEIDGVSGEVGKIGLLKTVLFEMGKWSETRYLTGRRVAFSNSFAMEGHYFNFSTPRQWLWDELRITLPSAGDPYAIAQQVREIVEQQTQADVEVAAKDFEYVMQRYKIRTFTDVLQTTECPNLVFLRGPYSYGFQGSTQDSEIRI